jgi:hypothetical protein
LADAGRFRVGVIDEFHPSRGKIRAVERRRRATENIERRRYRQRGREGDIDGSGVALRGWTYIPGGLKRGGEQIHRQR